MRYLAMVCLALVSCGTYRSYQRPSEATNNIEELYRNDQSATKSLATLSWRELFTDPKLQGIIERGLAQNADLRIAALNIDQAESTLKVSRMGYLPTLNLGADGSLSSFDGGAARETYSVGLDAAWEIDLFGKKWNAKERAKVAVEQSQALEQGVQTRLIATISKSYYTLLMLDRQAQITEQTIANREDNLRALHSLKRNGSITDAAIAQAEAVKIQIEQSLVALKRQISSVENSLSVLVGSTPSTIERGELGSLEIPETISTGVALELLTMRPDIRSAELALASAHYATNGARAALYPSIKLTGSAGWANSSGAIVADPMALLLNAAASLTQPLLNAGSRRAELEISKSKMEQAEIRFCQTILEAGAEVNDALTAIYSAQERLGLDTKRLAANERALYTTRKLMEHGSTNWLEVLVAEQTLLQAQLAEVENQFSKASGVIDLYYALGGGQQ